MRRQLSPLALAALCLSGCVDSSHPTFGVRVVVATTGVDEDPDGYLAIVENKYRARIAANGARELALEPGTYEVRIEELAPNCALQGPASERVTIEPGGLVEVAFTVECRAVTGVIQVRAPTSGRDFPLQGYSIYLTNPRGDTWLRFVPANHMADEVVATGQYSLQFQPVANCNPTGEATRIASVTGGGLTRDTTKVEFEVTCQATTGDIRFSIATTGTALDPNGYSVALDGDPVNVVDDMWDEWVPLRLASNGSRLLERVVPGDHTVTLGDVAGNCTVQGVHPRPVSVSLGAVSELAIEVACSAS